MSAEVLDPNGQPYPPADPNEGRRAPVQGTLRRDPRGVKPRGTIDWAEYLAIYEVYAGRYGRQQTAERMAERGGFGYWEIADLIGREPQTWEPRA